MATAHENRFFRAWGQLIVRHRVLALLLLSSASIGFIYAAARGTRIETSVETFIAADSPVLRSLRTLRSTFGNDVYFQVVASGDVFSRDFLARLEGLHRDLADIEVDLLDRPPGEPRRSRAIHTISSLINASDVRMIDGELRVTPVADGDPAALDLPALKRRVLADRTLVGRVVSASGRDAPLVLRIEKASERDQGRIYDRIADVVKRYRAPGFEIAVSGMPVLTTQLTKVVQADLRSTFRLSVIAMVLVLLVLFRHPIGVFGPMLVVVQAVGWTLGAMALADVPITLVSNILPAFVICVAITDGIHLQSVYRDARRDGLDSDAAVVHAVAATGLPIVFTSLTTIVGLISFRTATLQAVQEMGTFAAFGVLAAMIYSLTFLPVFLTFNRNSLLGLRPSTATRDGLDRALMRCDALSRARRAGGRTSYRGRNLVLLGAFAVLMVSFAGAARLRVHHDPLSWVPKDNPVIRDFERINAQVGGTAGVDVLIDAKGERGAADLEVARAIERFERHAAAYRHAADAPAGGGDRPFVSAVASYLDLTRKGFAALSEGEPALPPNQGALNDVLVLLESSASGLLRELTTLDYQKAVVHVRVPWLDALAYRPFTDYLEAGARKYLTGHAEFQITGSVYGAISVVQAVLLDLLSSFGWAFLIDTILMVLLLRSLKLGLIAQVPNLLPTLCVMGVMGFAGIPIDISNLLIASIAIGISVDSTLHMMHQFSLHYEWHGDVDGAIAHAFKDSGRAVVVSTVIQVIGFGVFMTADMLNVLRFGLLTVLTVLFALVGDLIVGPALLRIAYRGRRPAIEQPALLSARPHAA